jgi:hypothetical protein
MLRAHLSDLLSTAPSGGRYSPSPSKRFAKEARTVQALVVVEATELGDVLATASLPHTQGVEIPTENSLVTDDGISQSVVFPFFMELLAGPTPPAHAVVPDGNSWTSSGAKPYWGTPPGGSCCCGGGNALPNDANTCQGHPLNGTCLWASQCSWGGVWRFRRSTAGAGPSVEAGVNVGDVSLQNWGHGNDMEAASLYLPTAAANATVANGSWAGGVNVTALRMTEDRAFGWYHALLEGSPLPAHPFVPPAHRFRLNSEYSGTGNGLVKFPYIRDTRRAVGLDGFRLNHTMQMAAAAALTDPKFGPHFHDAVGLGSYNFDIKPGSGYGSSNGGARRLPGYMWNFTSNTGLSGHAAPFYFPFRALTVAGAPNVLAAGKTIAMTYAANTAAREHADEWSSGVAAGAAAVVMAGRNWTSATMLANVAVLQATLSSPAVQQPLAWSPPPSPPSPPSPSPPSPSPGRFVCGGGRCFEADGGSSAGRTGTFPNASCVGPASGRSMCPPPSPDQWLLLKAHWRVGAAGTSAVAVADTWLKKSERDGGSLPADEKRHVDKGTTLRALERLLSADQQYWLATLQP